jgi:diguanylate cyclase (GGDEF)-like protein
MVQPALSIVPDTEARGDVRAEDLAHFELLRNVAPSDIEQLLQSGRLVEVPSGTAIIEKGQLRSTMFMLIAGELSVHLDTLDGEMVALLKAGQTVGELSLLDKAPASAFVRTATDARLLALDEESLWRLIFSSHAFAVNLLTQLTTRLRANNDVVSDSHRQRKVFERAAMFDGLTGVHNRRWFDQALERMVARFERSHEPLALAVTDVDHFKKFNDTYGHRAGDEVLVAVARALSDGLRPTDLLARYGGEEFVVILPTTDLSGACIAAERLRVKVADTPVFDADGTPLPKVTISIGVAELDETMTHEELFRRADAALYEAKHSGRNRVAAAGVAAVQAADGSEPEQAKSPTAAPTEK